jgi:methyltransferase-like protein
LKPDQLQVFYISSRVQPTEAEFDLSAQAVVRFCASDGAVLSTDHPLSKAAILCLADAWPRALSFEELLSMAQLRLGLPARQASRIAEGSPGEDALVLGTNLLRAFTYSGNLVELYAYAPRLVLDLSERPRASPVAQWQARRGDRVTNLRHERVRLDPVERLLLLYLDGEHDLAALVERLREGPVAEGALAVQNDGESVTDPAQVDQLLARGVQRCLSALARAALLVG